MYKKLRNLITKALQQYAMLELLFALSWICIFVYSLFAYTNPMFAVFAAFMIVLFFYGFAKNVKRVRNIAMLINTAVLIYTTIRSIDHMAVIHSYLFVLILLSIFSAYYIENS